MKRNKLGIWTLTALVVGNMVGSGIFMLPQSLAKAASPAGVLLAWMLTGLRSFNAFPCVRKPISP